MRKLFEVSGQAARGWTDSSKTIVGVTMEGQEISFTIVKGSDLTAAGFLRLLSDDNGVFEVMGVPAKYERKNPYKVEYVKGALGVTYLEPVGDGFYQKRRGSELYFSCFGKFAGGKFFFPDLEAILEAEAFQELLRSHECDEIYKEIKVREIPEVDLSEFTIPAG